MVSLQRSILLDTIQFNSNMNQKSSSGFIISSSFLFLIWALVCGVFGLVVDWIVFSGALRWGVVNGARIVVGMVSLIAMLPIESLIAFLASLGALLSHGNSFCRCGGSSIHSSI